MHFRVWCRITDCHLLNVGVVLFLRTLRQGQRFHTIEPCLAFGNSLRRYAESYSLIGDEQSGISPPLSVNIRCRKQWAAKERLLRIFRGTESFQGQLTTIEMDDTKSVAS